MLADVPLAAFTTLHLGGPAGRLWECATRDELIATARPGVLVLGGGSNVVLPDEGVPEVALVRTRGIARIGDRVVVQAGEDWDALVAWSVAEGLAGLEALSGIPGTVGASPVQNIGAYGTDVSSVVASVTVLDRTSGEVAELTDCGFAYRTSRFKGSDRWLVLDVSFTLTEDPLSAHIGYAELAAVLDVQIGDRAPLGEVREAVLQLRSSKGMVVSGTDPDSVSVGSFFTNPVVDAAPDGAPRWPEADGRVKVSAAWLIERSGFPKGWGDGRIGLSTKHSLALVNRGGGTTAELLEVARTIRDGVRDRFGIELVNEPVLVGTAL